jgi:tripartite-type tricarboxylate transporter receptor subunit TctC
MKDNDRRHHLQFHLSRRKALAAGLAYAGPFAAPLAFAQAASTSSGQAYPGRPIRLMVGYAPGGGVDALARLLAVRLSASLGQQLIVENRAGATGMIAADAVARSAPDGYTLLMGESGLLIARLLQPNSPIDPLKALKPVAGAFVAPLLIVANNDIPAATPAELIALIKANPGRYSYATSGIGTVHHLGFEMIKARTGAFIVHIPYRGAAQIVPDVIGGRVAFGVVSAAAGLAQARAGKVRAVALMNTGKLPGAENVPPLADALPGFNVAPRLMLLAPAGTPDAVIARLDEAVRSALASPELVNAAAQQGAIPAYTPTAALAAEMVRESSDWQQVIRSQNISAQS